MKKTFYILSGILICINLYWVFATPLLPFIDLPFHLAEAFVVKNFGNPEFLFGRYYTIPTFIKSNTLHTFFCAAGVFHDVETGNKIYYAAYVILLPLSVWYLIRILGGNIYFSLLSFLFTVNYSVHWGFTGYTMSVPVLFILFALYYIYFIGGKSKAGFVIFLLILILFMLHFQTAIFAMLVFGILQIYYKRKSLRHWIQMTIIFVPILVIMFAAYSADSDGGTSLSGFLFNYYMLDYPGAFLNRLGIFFILDNFFLFRGITGVIYSLIISVSIVLLFLSGLRFRSINGNPGMKFLFIILSISAACYIFLPGNINGQNIIFERYSVITLILMAVCASMEIRLETKGSRNKIFAGIFFSAILLLHGAVISDYMNDFRKESRDFGREIFSVCSKSVMAGVITDNDFRGRKVWTHFPMYYTVWNGGVTTGLIDYKFGLIKRNVPKEVLPQYKEWLDDSKTDFGRYYMSAGYILTRSTGEPVLNGFTLHRTSGKWRLYRNAYSVSP
ncbi:MAG: hypothetical protein LWX07_04770 [Bacteroidetes bacterium]|nr:hypothetical protein [Bacteroidota bacterium]